MTVFDGSPKDYAASKGFGKAGRGRMGKDALAAVTQARAEGITFSKESATVTPVKAPKIVVKGAASKASVPTEKAPAVDSKSVREWASKNGFTPGARGRLNSEWVSGYLASVKPEDRKEAAPLSVKDLRQAAPQTNFSEKFQGFLNGKSITVSNRTVCSPCGVSLSHHLCNTPRVVFGGGDLLAVSPL